MNEQNFMDSKTLEIIKIEGPVLPVRIAQGLGTTILMASAKLSELASKKLVKISNAKIGGSPVYYIAGQEEKLEILHKYLPQMEKYAYDMLKGKKTLKDKECAPGIRVALRAIKDFAVPFMFNNEVYWKWHLISEQEIMQILGVAREEEKIEPEKTEIKQEVTTLLQEAGKIEQVIEEKKIEKREKAAKKHRKTGKTDEFLLEINDYIERENYNVLEEIEVKKNKEVCKTVKVNSDLGMLKYFLCAVNKKKISDSDLSLAYSKGQGKKLPVLFLSKGELNKKAEKYIAENSLIVFKKI